MVIGIVEKECICYWNIWNIKEYLNFFNVRKYDYDSVYIFIVEVILLNFW